MSSLSNRALLLELGIYLVDNNIRRGILSVAANIQATDSELQESSKKLSPGDTWTFTSLTNNKGTIVRVSGGPVTVSALHETDTWQFKIDSVFVCTDKLGNITFTNPALATADVLVRVIQA